MGNFTDSYWFFLSFLVQALHHGSNRAFSCRTDLLTSDSPKTDFILKDLSGGNFEKKNIFIPIGVHTFEKIDFKVEIIAIFSNKRNFFPDPITRWFVTKWNPKMS